MLTYGQATPVAGGGPADTAYAQLDHGAPHPSLTPQVAGQGVVVTEPVYYGADAEVVLNQNRLDNVYAAADADAEA